MVGRRHYHLDKVNQRFGRLIFKGMTDELHPTAGRYLGKFVCDCGQITCVLPTTVFRGETKSCGCYRKELGSDPRMVLIRSFGHHQSDILSSRNSTGYKNISLRKGQKKYRVKLSFQGELY